MERIDTMEDRVRKQIDEERGFYKHAFVYIVIIGTLWLLDWWAGGGYSAYWATFGWGIGLLLHGVSVFGFGLALGRDWEERRYRKLMDRERHDR